jgi:predicted nucleic acid-binding protein
MIILDTSIWIEFFRGNDPYFNKVSLLLRSGEVMGLSWIFGELLQGASTSKEAQLILKTWNGIRKPELQISETAWISAGEASQKGKWHSKGIGLIDAAIISVSEQYKVPVWTLDKKLYEILKFKRLAISL